jgi:glyoxylase-like metal-dependent hydrolase (beta-lactamase superfamily II)
MLEQPTTAPFVVPVTVPPSKPERLLKEWDELSVGNLRFTVVHTPGHTPGSICLFEPVRKVLFSGDTLFASGYGRTDLPGGDEAQLELSLGRLAALPHDVQVYPGHGPATTIGDEAWLQSYRPG